MGSIIVIVCLGAALNLALFVAIHRRLAAIERATGARVRPDAQALDAAAARVGGIVTSLESQVLRAQAA
ncbi:MAG: hypothetical protein KDA22_14825, partial [Phycisphaerales bacterium]|nr:hypothetical protein [Phycisphaerales bacterium]